MADAAGGAGAVTSAAVCAALDSCDRIDEGHTAWMLVATGFVLLCVRRVLHHSVLRHCAW
jgi:hypothetical protein